MRIAFIVAMDKEMAQLRTLIDNVEERQLGSVKAFCGQFGGNEVLLGQCGIGKVNAAVGATEIINGFKPQLVVSTGVAGGANTELQVMDVVMSSECCFHDVYCGSECAAGQVLGMPARFASYQPKKEIDTTGLAGRIVKGLTVTGDWFVDSREKMRAILDVFPDAMAVDMESAAIAQVCHVYNVDFLSFRIISDVPLRDTNAAQYFDFWNSLANGSFEVTKRLLGSL